MKKVLVVEDNDVYFMFIENVLKGKVEIMRAKILHEGYVLFRENPDFDLIIMDACVPGDNPNAMPLVEEIVKSGYDKPIIASSTVKDYRQELIDAGATHEANKREGAEMALKLLGL